MKSSKYWEDAALLREIAVQEGATATAADILKLYEEALSDINTEVRKIKANFTRRFGIDNKTATYFLEAAQEEENLQMLINALESAPTQKAREDILTYIHLDGLSVRAYAARTERYNAVKKSIYARMALLAADETKLMTNMLKNAYKESYYGLIDDTAKGFDVGINFALLDDDAIEEAIKTKWHGSRFSERIWKNTDRLAEEAQNLVTKALMSGESLTKTATKLADSFNVEKYHATTLVRTETAHAHAMADLKGYEDLGIKEYKYLATLDYLTCTRCQPLDGMVFKVSEAREGVNYPTLHPRCRCTTTMNMEYTSRRARDPETGRNITIDGNTTYSEWVKNMTPEQRQALDIAKRKNDNKTSDKLQHAKYRKALGTKQVPRGFKEFQELKYKNPERWTELKGLYGKTVDKSTKSGIINTKIINNDVVNPMHEERYRAMCKGLSKKGIITLEAKDDDLRYLRAIGAEASYGHGYIMHIGRIPSASAMFEEVIHATQARKYGEFDSSDIVELCAREISANRMLIRNKVAYGFDDVDVVDIEKNLQHWEKTFEREVGCSYDQSSYRREI